MRTDLLDLRTDSPSMCTKVLCTDFALRTCRHGRTLSESDLRSIRPDLQEKPQFADFHLKLAICFKCWLLHCLHKDPGECVFQDVVPQLVFMLYVHHHGEMAAAPELPEVNACTTFAQFWAMVKHRNADGFANTMKYAMWGVAHLGIDSIGL
ncbi:hypothetical protein AURDEDRAFT_175403 [Auricularia subglabra TFB-10046 SS5]|nr:hypothetical protein AURDEDRAFT_175403 [Auricularia subglabra TFB-10046 SS5]